MSLRKVIVAAAVVLSASAAAPSNASADWLLTPFLGSTFGGNADINNPSGSTFSNDFEQKINYGASIGWMGARVVGFEKRTSSTGPTSREVGVSGRDPPLCSWDTQPQLRKRWPNTIAQARVNRKYETESILEDSVATRPLQYSTHIFQ
jgi:hypothetical protein